MNRLIDWGRNTLARAARLLVKGLKIAGKWLKEKLLWLGRWLLDKLTALYKWLKKAIIAIEIDIAILANKVYVLLKQNLRLE